MTNFQLAAIVVSLTAALAYVNAKLLRLPSSVGLMAIALVGSFTLLAIEQLGVGVSDHVRVLVTELDFSATLLHGMLGLLLFAGALHIDVAGLGADKLAVTTLALGGTLLSTILVGGAIDLVLGAIGVPIAPIEAFLFGALISPTDPIAVLGVLKSVEAPPELETRIAGESLFNDGIGVVIFTTVLAIASGRNVSAGEIGAVFVREALGGAGFGLVTGYLAYRLVRSIDDYTVEVLITLALVIGGYAAAEAIGVSAPLAAIIAGLLIGTRAPHAMSDRTRMYLDSFWKLVDEVLNAVLFMLIGITLLVLPFHRGMVRAALLAVPIVLAARWISVALPLTALGRFRASTPHSIKILTWGGLRGGLSIAMALSLPASNARDIILGMTYAVVAWSILVQGMTFGPLLRRLERRP
ncbi:MAG TPA: sodium:proton antiporter [Kofleriaceae bacterium]|jgi:CPA1 family monovalent cation:H+ antiporter|nr:sodium:proton antiporter [Kofleriaceae bacterium]